MRKVLNSTFVKCASLLLVLMVVFGGTLAFLNDLWYVSPETRTARAIQKVYGEMVEFNTIFDIDNQNYNDQSLTESELPMIISSNGRINKIYSIGNDTLFQATGYQGYKGGSITLWVKVISNQGRLVIDKVLLENFDKQTLMSKLDGNYYGNFLVDITDAYSLGQGFTTSSNNGEFSNPVSGATYSANAANNAVNCVINYFGLGGLR